MRFAIDRIILLKSAEDGFVASDSYIPRLEGKFRKGLFVKN